MTAPRVRVLARPVEGDRRAGLRPGRSTRTSEAGADRRRRPAELRAGEGRHHPAHAHRGQPLSRYGVNVERDRAPRPHPDDDGDAAASTSKEPATSISSRPRTCRRWSRSSRRRPRRKVSGQVFIVWGRQISVLHGPLVDRQFESTTSGRPTKCRSQLVPFYDHRKPIEHGFLFVRTAAVDGLPAACVAQPTKPRVRMSRQLDIEPFRIDVPDAALEDLRERLARTRFPEQIPDAGWDYGTELGYLRELVGYWRDGYDWRKTEARLNELDHFTTEIDGAAHPLRPRALARAGRVPPRDHARLAGIVRRVRGDPAAAHRPGAHGGDPADAFHVVCPSIPGYAFSGPTHERGWDTATRRRRRGPSSWPRLGYERYGAQGGDWGVDDLARSSRSSTPSTAPGCTSTWSSAALRPTTDCEPHAGGGRRASPSMTVVHGRRLRLLQDAATKPQTIGYSLDDSPAGSRRGSSRSSARGPTATATSSRLHQGPADRQPDAVLGHRDRALVGADVLRVERRPGTSAPPDGRVEVSDRMRALPEGDHARRPARGPRTAYNVVHWTEMPRGGHFAAMEEPELLAADVREFFRRPLRRCR